MEIGDSYKPKVSKKKEKKSKIVYLHLYIII